MNTMTIVLLALQGAASAITLAQKFITNESVLKVLDTVSEAIQVALTLLGGLHTKLAKGVADGEIEVSDANLGGLKVEHKQ